MTNAADTGVEFWSAFRTLRDAASDTPEGRGGVASISGFAFQFLVSLDTMVQAAIHADKVGVFLESLSDLAVVRGGHIEVSQVKLTLSSVATGKGLEDLWKVHQLALATTPELVASLRYIILGNKVERNRRDAARARLLTWRPSSPFDQDQLDDFRSRLSVEINTDPRLNLAVSLVNLFAIDDPFARIERWMGMLFGAASHAGFSAEVEAIAVELEGLAAHRREVEARFRLWSANDRPPEAVVREPAPSKWVLTGQTPERDDLREGRFAPRPIYSSIDEKAEQWLGSATRTDRGGIAAFWITGCSGSGKSVALLHLLSSLHEADPGRAIIWLGQDAGRIGEAVQWCSPFLRDGRQVIISADDPFTSAKRTEVLSALAGAKTELDSLQELYPDAPRPVLILCGPSEQAEAFEDELSDFVQTLSFSVPHQAFEEIEALRAWYRQRTGGAQLPMGETEGVLIVQLFFEWATGMKIGAFARRLKRRLKDLASGGRPELFDMVARILAVNRLYAHYPAAAATAELAASPDLEAGFGRLAAAEGHFNLDTRSGGYRLTHPHLADAIYKTWFDRPSDAAFRKGHLRLAIRAALEFGQGVSQRFAPLWAISRLVSPRFRNNADVADRITLIQDDLQALLPEIFEAHFSATAEPLVELPVWAALDEALSLRLTPSPVQALIDAADRAPNNAPGLRLACHILIDCAGEWPEARDRVRQILTTHREWREWPKVSLSYSKRYGLVDLQPLLEAFARVNPDRARPLVFSILKGAERLEEGGEAIVEGWLQPDDPYLEFQAGAMSLAIERWGELPWVRAVALKILTDYPQHRSWSHLWEQLATQSPDDKELERLGRRWVSDRDPGKHNWDRVWEALWVGAPGDGDLRQDAIAWLKDRPGHASWSHIWQRLWDAKPADAGLLRLAVEWLERQFEHPSWSHTWQKLWEATPADAALRQLALRWLTAQPAHLSWSFTWQKLLEAAPADTDLHQMAIDWLKAQSGEKSWSHTFQKLWLATARKVEVRQLGLDWLVDQPEDESWYYIWRDLRAASPDDDLQRLALDWLEGQPKHASWSYVWRSLWVEAPDDDRRQLALNWLTGQPSHPSWQFIWQDLWMAMPADAMLRRLGLDWLKQASQRSNLVKKALGVGSPAPPSQNRWAGSDRWIAAWYRASDNDVVRRELYSEALITLSAMNLEERGWTSVWRVLWQNRRAEACTDPYRLRDLALAWLGQVDPEHPRWSSTWCALWLETRGGDLAERQVEAALSSSALEWLSGPSPRMEWPRPWRLLWRESPHLKERLAALVETGPRSADFKVEPDAEVAACLGS